MAKAQTPFDDFFKRAVEHEGKVCEDVPGDGGGPTKWGITIGRLCTSKGIKVPKRGTAAFEALKEELYALSEAQIKEFYRRDYWDVVRADELPPGINYICADFSLNSGPSRAIKALQKLCGNPQTGKMDDQTLAEAHAFDRVELIMLYQEERTRFLNAIVANRPNQRKFLKGWLNRVGDVKRAAIKMADAESSASAPAPQPMPKATVPDTPPPSPAKEAIKSPSIWLLFTTLLGKVLDFFFGIGNAIADWLGSLADLLTAAQTETDTTIAPLASLSRTLEINLGSIMTWVTALVLLVVIFRHLGDKVEKAKLKQHLPEPEGV